MSKIKIESRRDLARVAHAHAQWRLEDLLRIMNRIPAKYRDHAEYLFLVVVLRIALQPVLRNADWIGIIQAIDELIQHPRCKKYMKPWLMYYKYSCLQEHSSTAQGCADALRQSHEELMLELSNLPKKVRKKLLREHGVQPLGVAS